MNSSADGGATSGAGYEGSLCHRREDMPTVADGQADDPSSPGSLGGTRNERGELGLPQEVDPARFIHPIGVEAQSRR